MTRAHAEPHHTSSAVHGGRGVFTVGRKAAVLFLLLLTLASGNVWLVKDILRNLQGVGETVNMAGKLRMLSQRTGFEAMAIPLGSPDGQQRVAENLRDFDAVFKALSEGGRALGHTVPGLPAHFKPQLQAIQNELGQFQARLQAIVAASREPASADAPSGQQLLALHRAISGDVVNVLLASEALVSGLVADNAKAQQRILRHMYLLLLFDALALLGAFWWTRRHLVEPLRALAIGCRQLAQGDYQIRIHHAASDEIGEVASAFNDSAERIGGLVSRLEREHEGLERAEAMFRAIAENPIAGIYIVQDGRFRFVNMRMVKMLGYEYTADMLNASVYDSVLDADKALVRESIRKRIEGEVGSVRYERKARRKDGGTIEVEVFGASMLLDGKPATMGLMLDLTQRNQARMTERLAFMAYQNSSEAMVITDTDACVRDVNPAFTAITGWRREEVLDRKLNMLSSGRHDKSFYQAMWGAIRTNGQWQGEIWNRRKNGEEYVQRLVIDTAYNPDGSVGFHIGVFSDITRRKQTEANLWRQANYDELTGLPNRHMFLHHLTNEISRSHRKTMSMALIFLDLDLFKQVNDSHGHEAGDALLRQVGARLINCVRDTDMVARLGGDEFTIVLSELGNPLVVERICMAIHEALALPFDLGGYSAQLSASIGIAFYPQHGTDPDTLVHHADMAMYKAKQFGPNRYAFYDQVDN